jgi:hypothetical protein
MTYPVLTTQTLALALRAARYSLPHRATADEALNALARELLAPHACEPVEVEHDALSSECVICGSAMTRDAETAEETH